ncbi:hypothetical protein ACFFMN_34450 [Planobispora siamensis]|nr:hypothetical protein [Planobispora siamensis]
MRNAPPGHPDFRAAFLLTAAAGAGLALAADDRSRREPVTGRS